MDDRKWRERSDNVCPGGAIASHSNKRFSGSSPECNSRILHGAAIGEATRFPIPIVWVCVV
eukprot:287987-Karenia_brevis.AAC.1